MEWACLGLLIVGVLGCWWVSSLQGPSVASTPHTQPDYTQGASAPLATSRHAARERERSQPRARQVAANRRRGMGVGVELQRIAPQSYEGRTVNARKVTYATHDGQPKVIGYQWVDWESS